MEAEAVESVSESESEFIRFITFLTLLWVAIAVGAGVLLVLFPEPFLSIYS